ncbi:MAG: T9SS type A sorting domain-containing protein [Saprospiraceae bacterium]|nr:T9SS type A sorting domain-containing protein [Saprospiraceae bacterium]
MRSKSNYWILPGTLVLWLVFSGSKMERPTTLTVDCPKPITLTEGSKFDTTVTGTPKVLTNTGGKVTIGYLEVYQKGDCKNRADLVTRIFTITNAAGDQVRCNQYITIQHLTINDIRIPTDTIIDHPDSLTSLTVKLLHIPKSLGSVRINFFDTRISQNCNIPVSIRRQWSIEDICNGQVRTGTTFMSVHKYFSSFKQIINKSDVVCEDEGFINLTSVGEFAPYSYKWNTGDSLSYLFNVRSGTYTLTITDRFNCTASVVYDLLSMAQRADIGGIIRNDKGIKVTPDSIVFENENLIKKFCISENIGLHYGFTLKTKTPGQYNFRMVKNSQSRDGISTKDIVMIQRHILGIDRFKDTAQNIAADVNFNFQITASDITEIRRIILGIKETFSVARPWYFLRQDWRSLAIPNRPISDIEFKGVNVLNFPLTNVNVFALKMGDVDVSYSGLSNPSVTRNGENSETYLETGQMTSEGIPVYLRSDGTMAGFQFSLAFESTVPLEIVQSQIPSQYYYLSKEGLRVSWDAGTKQNLDPSKPLFVIRSNADSKLILTEELGAEYYDNSLNTFPLSLKQKEDEKLIQKTSHWFYPNPATDKVLISLTESEHSILKIYNLQGVELEKYKWAGKSKQLIELKHLQRGIYILKLEASDAKIRWARLILQ